MQFYNELNNLGLSYIFVYKEEVFTSRNSFVDFAVSYIGEDLEEETICCEIKISEDDFNSKYGSNFYGTENYYVVPEYMKDFALDKINNNALYNNIGLIVVSDTEDGYVHIKCERSCKKFKENDITRALKNNLIENGTYIGKGNIELKKNTFRFFNNCNKYDNEKLLKNMIRTSNGLNY